MNRPVADDLLVRLKAAPRVGCSDLLDSQPLLLDPAAGHARLRFTAGVDFCDSNGHVLGGFLAAMMDEAMAIAAVAQRHFRQAVPTLAMQLSCLRPVTPGPLLVDAWVRHSEPQLAFLRAELRTDGGSEVCATANATARYTQDRPL